MCQQTSTAVLVVDDDPNFRVWVRAALPPSEFSISEAADGIMAQSRLQGGEFDLIILDIFMPERDGLELIPEIRNLQPRSRILAVSGTGDAVLYLQIARLMGADCALTKPFTIENFGRCIRNLRDGPAGITG